MLYNNASWLNNICITIIVDHDSLEMFDLWQIQFEDNFLWKNPRIYGILPRNGTLNKVLCSDYWKKNIITDQPYKIKHIPKNNVILKTQDTSQNKMKL